MMRTDGIGVGVTVGVLVAVGIRVSVGVMETADEIDDDPQA